MKNNPLQLPNNGLIRQGVDADTTTLFHYGFRSRTWGFRAAFMMIRLWQRQGLATTLGHLMMLLSQDKSELDAWYVRRKVEILSGMKRDTRLDPLNRAQMITLVAAISHAFEGKAPRMSEVAQGWLLYLG